jgi:hypothetical protein
MVGSVHVIGKENNIAGPRILVSNHARVSDVFLLPFVLGDYRGLTQIESFTLPFFGWLLARAGMIPITPGRGRQAMDRAREQLIKGRTILVYRKAAQSWREMVGPRRAWRGGLSVRRHPARWRSMSGQVLPDGTTSVRPPTWCMAVGGRPGSPSASRRPFANLVSFGADLRPVTDGSRVARLPNRRGRRPAEKIDGHLTELRGLMAPPPIGVPVCLPPSGPRVAPKATSSPCLDAMPTTRRAVCGRC